MIRSCVTVLATILLAGCSGAAPNGEVNAGRARTEVPEVATAASSTLARLPAELPTADVVSPSSLLRVVNATSDAPPLDFCLRARGALDAPFDVGPLLLTQGLSGGLAYGEVSAYVAVLPGAYDARIVAGGASDCATALDGIPDRSDVPSLEPDGYATLVAVGSLAKSFFGMDLYRDDRTVSQGNAKVRFVHATVAAPALDVGTKSGEEFAPLFGGVAFRTAAAGAGVDENGFVETPPNDTPTFALRVAGKSFDVLSLSGPALAADSITSMFSIGVAGMKGRLVPAVVACADLDTSRAPLSTCTTAP